MKFRGIVEPQERMKGLEVPDAVVDGAKKPEAAVAMLHAGEPPRRRTRPAASPE